MEKGVIKKYVVKMEKNNTNNENDGNNAKGIKINIDFLQKKFSVKLKMLSNNRTFLSSGSSSITEQNNKQLLNNNNIYNRNIPKIVGSQRNINNNTNVQKMVGSQQNTNNIQKQNIQSNINNVNIPKLVGNHQNTNNNNDSSNLALMMNYHNRHHITHTRGNTSNIVPQNMSTRLANMNMQENTNNQTVNNTNTQENVNTQENTNTNRQENTILDVFNAPTISANQQLVEKLKSCNDIVKYIALLQSSYPLALVFQLEYGFSNSQEKSLMLNKFSQSVVNKSLDQNEIESRWNLIIMSINIFFNNVDFPTNSSISNDQDYCNRFKRTVTDLHDLLLVYLFPETSDCNVSGPDFSSSFFQPTNALNFENDLEDAELDDEN